MRAANRIAFGRARPHPLPAAHTPEQDGFRRRFDSGRISVGFGTEGLDCIILEISQNEAHVRVHVEPGSVPRNVFLVHYRTFTAYQASVSYVGSDDTLWLELLASFDLKANAKPELDELRQLCVRH